MDRTPRLGLIISSEKFAFGFQHPTEKGIICVDGKTTEHLTQDHGKKVRDTASVDPKRAEKQYVIISAQKDGAYHMSPVFLVRAQEMVRGKHDPDGQILEFYYPDGRTYAIGDYEVHGQLKVKFG